MRCWEDAKGTEVGTGGQFVWFEPTEKTSPQVARISLDDDRSIVRAGSVKVSVQATPQVRHQILDSIQIVDTDHNGCPAVPPFAGRPQWRPQGPELSKIGPPTAISACRYIAARLRSSIRLTGSESAAALAAIKQAPVLGYGPNPPAASCVPDLIPRADQILLRITPKKTIALRYSGCLVPGLDDGTDVHALSRANVQPFLAGPNRVDTSMNPQLAEVLGDNPAR